MGTNLDGDARRVISTIQELASEWGEYGRIGRLSTFQSDTLWVGEGCYEDEDGTEHDIRVVLPLEWLTMEEPELKQMITEMGVESAKRDSMLRDQISRHRDLQREARTKSAYAEVLATTLATISELAVIKDLVGPELLANLTDVTLEAAEEAARVQKICSDADDKIGADLPMITEGTLDPSNIFPARVRMHPWRSYDEYVF